MFIASFNFVIIMCLISPECEAAGPLPAQGTPRP